METGPGSEPPAWYLKALAAEVQVQHTEVDGVSVASRSWGEPSGNDVILLHGGAAHSRWWDHIAPLLAHGRRVVALDLSGHGDSGHRSTYSFEQWGAEVLAVASDVGVSERPTIVGHSMGGLVTLGLARRSGLALAGAIMIDSPVVRGLADEGGRTSRPAPGLGSRTYPTEADAVAHFRPIPRQESLPFVFEHIARTSVCEVDGAWGWKFDSGLFAAEASRQLLQAELQSRLVYFRAENGLVPVAETPAILGLGATLIEIPGAGHAPMLDQPLALVAGIRSVLALWG